MITLVASTVTKLISPVNYERYIRITSDSTTLTRIAYDSNKLDVASGGFSFTVADNIVVHLPVNSSIYAISSGTPNLGIAISTEFAIKLM